MKLGSNLFFQVVGYINNVDPRSKTPCKFTDFVFRKNTRSHYMIDERDQDLKDLEAFAEVNFDPVQTLSKLLQRTNVLDDTEFDLDTSAKKLQFDAKECKSRMKSVTANHYDQLIDNVSSVGSYSEAVLERIVPLATRIELAYQRINNEFVRPYDEAAKLQSSLKLAHSTLSLLRGAGYFLLFVQQVQESEDQYLNSDDPKIVLKLARLLKQLLLIYSNEVVWVGNGVNITSLELLRSYRSIAQTKAKDFISDLNSKVAHGLGHHTSFNASNLSLQNSLLALHEMDLNLFFSKIEETIFKSNQIALVLLSRTLQSQRNLEMTFSDVKSTASSFIDTMCDLLLTCKLNRPEQDSQETLLQAFEAHLVSKNEDSISDLYWSRLTRLYKKNILATLAKGGPVARNLQNNKVQMTQAVEATFDDPQKAYLLESLSILVNN